MAGLCKIVLLMLLLAPITFCNAKGWLDWLYGTGDADADAGGKKVKKNRLSVIPGVLKDQIESMHKDLRKLPRDSSEDRTLLRLRIDKRERQLRNIQLIANGMPLDEFDEFVELDDELAILRMKLRPKAQDRDALRDDPDHSRMMELVAHLDATRKRYGITVRKGDQTPEVIQNFHQRHMSKEVVNEVRRLREQLQVETDVEKIHAIRNQLDDLYTRHEKRDQPTEEELAVIDAETKTLKNELKLTSIYLDQAHERHDDNAIHLGRLKLRDIHAVLGQSVMQRVLGLRKERHYKLHAERVEESGPPA